MDGREDPSGSLMQPGDVDAALREANKLLTQSYQLLRRVPWSDNVAAQHDPRRRLVALVVEARGLLDKMLYSESEP